MGNVSSSSISSLDGARQAAHRLAVDCADELIGLLCALARVPSVNSADGGHIDGEQAVAECLADYLRGHGLASRRMAPTGHTARVSLLAELDSGQPGPTLLFMSHLDVVASGDASAWKHPPFSGALAEGRVWGRGVIDCKMLVAAQAFAMTVLKRLGLPARGRVRLIAAADEETGGRLGFGWLAAEHPDLLRADLAICEGGGSTIGNFGGGLGGDCPFVSVGCGEKGRYGVTFEAIGPGGHASSPWGRPNPLEPFGELLRRIAQWRPDARPASPVFECLAPLLGFAEGIAPEEVDATIDKAQALVPDYVRSLRAQSRMTFVPTIMRAGEGANVIPTRARLTCDARLLPGQNEDDLRAAIAGLLAGLEGIDVAIETFAPPSQNPLPDALLARFEAAASMATGRPVRAVPTWCAGATDAHWVRPLGTPVYGFQFLFPDSDPKRQGIHCVNESIDSPAVLACALSLAHFALAPTNEKQS
jgi:acetylornithine deacetylase/succinyl-diaminopimelate desuccinylase-like protein